MIYSVLVFRGIDTLLSYTAGDLDIQIGQYVTVPFGRMTIQGVVIGPDDSNPEYALKPIRAIDDSLPQLSREMVALITWFSHTYCTTPYLAYQTIVGKNRKLVTGKPSEPVPTTPDFALNEAQSTAVTQILTAPNPYLLFGVTGSGKTEVYIHLSRHFLAQGKQVLILLPEIALTPQVNAYFQSRFGDTVAVLHSGFTPKQKNVQWTRIVTGDAQIVIGPRSSIFAPVANLGLIVIDEAHDSSYKQDNNPRYHTHSVAEFRANQAGATIVYGTATPDVAMVHRFQNTSQLVRLDGRIHAKPMPTIQLIDMQDKPNEPRQITTELLEKLRDRLSKKQKSIILVNRRGYAPYIACKFCQAPFQCSSCNLSYTYHSDQTFRCHRCCVQTPLTYTCQKCKRNGLQFNGIAIQKIELELKQAFPDASVIRLDRDSATTAKQQERLLAEFKQSGDILIGTQMVAKGHHIESVTLIGILGIESVLNIPDYRSAQKAYQLITQVAGRAGRGRLPGEVVIQTFQPEHYAITCAQRYDFTSFYEMEIEAREELTYPPYCQLVRLIFSGKFKSRVQSYAHDCYDFLMIKDGERELIITDPQPAPIEKQNDQYRFHFMIKSRAHDYESLLHDLKHLPKVPASTKLMLDINPMSIL